MPVLTFLPYSMGQIVSFFLSPEIRYSIISDIIDAISRISNTLQMNPLICTNLITKIGPMATPKNEITQ